jgi:photosystem II stability/assembly factor-like uncharacterized protein
MRRLIQFIFTLILFCTAGCSKDDSNDITAPTTLTLQWEQTNLSSGNIWALEISSSGNLYASVFNEGFYRSADQGNTWTKIVENNFTSQNNSGSAACIYTDGDEIWVGTHGAGIHYSSDAGATWNENNIGMLMAQNFSLINNNSFNNLICASASGAYKFGNFGWVQIHNQWSYALCSNKDGVLFSFGPIHNSISESNVYTSSDNGITWDTKSLIGGINSADIAGGNTVFAAGTAMHRSTDLGRTWVQVISEIPALINIIKATPEGFIFTGTDGAGVYYSLNNGVRWYEGNAGLTNFKVTELVVAPSGYIYIGTEGKGVFKAKYR